MKKALLLIIITATVVVACKTVPLTGRRGLKLVPSSEINAMSFQQYNQLKSDAKLVKSGPQYEAVKRVGARIQEATERFLREKGYGDKLDGYEWEFILIDEPNTVNAFCMPGGKVAFYSGILPLCQNDEGIAVVMGHEIAHAIAEHGNERMSQGLVQQLGGVALSVALSTEPEKTQNLFAMAYGLGTQYGVMLPYSRKHESEADELGLYFMSMAGYNPEVAPQFWQRMSAEGGPKPAEILSTHPSDATRIANLNKHMAKAKTYYAANKK